MTHDDLNGEESAARSPHLFFKASASVDGNDEAVEDEKPRRFRRRRHHRYSMKRHRKYQKRALKSASQEFDPSEQTIDENPEVSNNKTDSGTGEPRRVDFAVTPTVESTGEGQGETISTKRPFNSLRGMSFRPVAKSLAPTVFVQPPDTVVPTVPAGPVPRVRYGIRRTNSLPDRLNQHYRAPGAMMPSQIPLAALANDQAAKPEDHDEDLSRTSAVFLLLLSTGLVALCAEFMVDSINGLVATSTVGEIFIGLIILPIVGNAAEHVTAITVAMKNKMDLAIGVAVGSSIQIALFITPLVVILGWIINRDMTLYFTLFETVCLFVSTFIVNFLVLDGRSNYLEGALLCATYVIISVVAFYYPNASDASVWGA
jgi:Ca2+:H+ antiporter